LLWSFLALLFSNPSISGLSGDHSFNKSHKGKYDGSLGGMVQVGHG
jgi:hypothetical protein